VHPGAPPAPESLVSAAAARRTIGHDAELARPRRVHGGAWRLCAALVTADISRALHACRYPFAGAAELGHAGMECDAAGRAHRRGTLAAGNGFVLPARLPA